MGPLRLFRPWPAWRFSCSFPRPGLAGGLYLAKNGSPWQQPLYPWSLFFVIALGIGIRCYSLCVSFHFRERQPNHLCGPYFLVPFGIRT